MKNWRFAGSAAVGPRAAAIQLLYETARLSGIEPMASLAGTLEKLPIWAQSSRRVVVDQEGSGLRYLRMWRVGALNAYTHQDKKTKQIIEL